MAWLTWRTNWRNYSMKKVFKTAAKCQPYACVHWWTFSAQSKDGDFGAGICTWPSYSIIRMYNILPSLCNIYTIYFPPCVIYIQYIHIGGIGTWPSYSIAIIPDWALAHVQPSSYPNTIPRSALKIENSAIVYLYCSFNCASVRC